MISGAEFVEWLAWQRRPPAAPAPVRIERTLDGGDYGVVTGRDGEERVVTLDRLQDVIERCEHMLAAYRALAALRKEQHMTEQLAGVRAGYVRAWDAPSYTATVQLAGSLQAFVAQIPVSRNIAAVEMVLGRRCSVAFMDPANHKDAVLFAVWP